MKKTILGALTVASFGLPAMAQDNIEVTLGVLNDRSGVYADLSGEGSVVAARMAVEDFDAASKGLDVEVISADHQNKPDIISRAPDSQPLWVIISRISCRSAGCNLWRIDSINSRASLEGNSSFAVAARPC